MLNSKNKFMQNFLTMTLLKMEKIKRPLLIFNFLILFAVGFSNGVLANDAEQDGKTYSLQCRESSVEWVFERLENLSGYSFLYQSSDIKNLKKVTRNFQKATLADIITICLKESGLSYEIRNKQVVIFPAPKESRPAPVKNPKNPVKGKITDRRGEPLAGANILIKGTLKGITSDEKGEYEIDAPERAILVFYYMGYQSKEVQVSGRIRIDITMDEEASMLKEVTVNAGYYTVKEREKTGSIGRVDAKIIEKQPVLSPIAAISGRITGAFIQQSTGIPGGDISIEIRGRNSLRPEGNEPLYVIDGVPFSSEKTSSASNLYSSGFSPLSTLNNADIESIEILKDADATAIYGSRGSNGVVLITTKKGKSGKTKFNLDIYSGGGKAPALKLLNTEQYLAMRREAFANEGYTTYPDDAYDINGTWESNRFTDWQKVLIGGTALSNSVQASLSGGSDGTQFILSGGYRSESSVFPGKFGYNKGSVHFSLNHLSPDKKLSIIFTFTGTIDRNDQAGYDFTNLSRRLTPNAPALYNADGSLNWENSTWKNPLSYIEQTYKGDVNTLVTNSVIGYNILKSLQVKASMGLTQVQTREKSMFPSTYFDPADNISSNRSEVLASSGSNQSWIIEPQANYEEKAGPGKLQILAGGSFQLQLFERISDMYHGFPSNSLMNNLNTASERYPRDYIKSEYKYAAFFGRINYSLKERYIINLTGRRDGSSRFGPGRQTANFFAAGFAWLFTNEGWIKRNFDFLNFGKLRISYGITGNDQIGNYEYLDSYTSSDVYQGIIALDPTRLYNPVFSWETNRKFEVATELGFLRDKITVNAGYYRNRCSNQLIDYAVPMTTGFTSIRSNFPATVQNTGIEIEINTTNFRKNNFKWITNLNFTIPKNRLVSFPDIASSSYANQYVVGESIYIKKVYECTGVDPETGLYTFKDYNGDGKISSPDDNKKIAFIGQQLYGGLNNTIIYKNFSIDIFFQFVKQSGYNYWASGPIPGAMVNQSTFVLKESRWQKPGDIAKLQKFATEYNSAASDKFMLFRESDGAISDASFIRLKNIQISYVLPGNFFRGAGCRLFLQAQNLFVITGYKGYDPESQFTRLTPLKMITAGINFNL
jgi:TonB-linked SusC/RagA family outer membrane protein